MLPWLGWSLVNLLLAVTCDAPAGAPPEIERAFRAIQEATRDSDAAGEELVEICIRAGVNAVLDPHNPDAGVEAGLLAAAYFLDYRQVLLGTRLTAELFAGLETEDQRRTRIDATRGARLLGRRDLATHFVVMAGLRCRLGERVTSSLGLRRELDDARRLDQGHGTGFSFVDLCANEAGMRFGGFLLERRGRLPAADALDLRDFMPSIAGLAEGLGEAQLQEEYGGPQGVRFRSRLERIRQRVAACPPYRGTTGGE